MQIFLECFCLLDLGQACLSLIITQVLFSARCVFYFRREGLVNRSGGVRRQVNRGRVFHSAWRGVFLACHRSSWMDNWALCEPSWQRGRRQKQRESENTSAMLEVIHLPLLQNTRPSATCPSTVEISKQFHLLQTHIKQLFKAQLISLIRPPLPPEGDKTWHYVGLFTLHLSEAFSTLADAYEIEVGKKEGSDCQCLHKCWCRRKDERRLSCQRNSGEIPWLCICLTDTRMGVGGGSACRCVNHVFISTACSPSSELQ